MKVGEVRVAEDQDFEIFKIYLNRNDGWKLDYEKGPTKVWTRIPPDQNDPKDPNSAESFFKMIRLKTVFKDVPSHVLYDVLQDPDYRKTWDKFMLESREIGHINPNNNICYYSISCPSPVKNRDFVIQSSWLQTPSEMMIINHSVHHVECPSKKGFIRATSYLTGFRVVPLSSGSSGGCELGYITHTNPKGNFPVWICNKLSTTFAPKLIKKLHRACLKYPEWKAAHGRSNKPWMHPEQIVSPKINLAECHDPEEGEAHSSPEESLEDIDTCDLAAHLSDTD